MQILDNEAYSDILSWLPEGNGFVIFDKVQFEKVILSKFMKKIRYSSFTRRMNRWNFVLYNFSSNSSRYFHPQFIRGDYAGAMEMRPEAQKQWRRTKDGGYEQRSPIEKKHISKTTMNAIIESNLESYRKLNRLEPVVMRQVGDESDQQTQSSNLSAPSARVPPVPSIPSVGHNHNLGLDYVVLAPVPVLSSQLPLLSAPENYYQGLYNQMTPQDYFLRPAAGFY